MFMVVHDLRHPSQSLFDTLNHLFGYVENLKRDIKNMKNQSAANVSIPYKSEVSNPFLHKGSSIISKRRRSINRNCNSFSEAVGKNDDEMFDIGDEDFDDAHVDEDTRIKVSETITFPAKDSNILCEKPTLRPPEMSAEMTQFS